MIQMLRSEMAVQLEEHSPLLLDIKEALDLLLVGRFRNSSSGEKVIVCGIIGPASNGKTLLFNSIIKKGLGKEYALSHSTHGPVAVVHTDWYRELEKSENGQGQKFWMPSLKRKIISIEEGRELTGEPDTLTIVTHENEELRKIILIDTPDMSSFKSRNEGDIAFALLKWFDCAALVCRHETLQEMKTENLVTRIKNELKLKFAMFYNRIGINEPEQDESLDKKIETLGPDIYTVLPRLNDDTEFFPDNILGNFKESFLKEISPGSSNVVSGIALAKIASIGKSAKERQIKLDDLKKSLTAIMEETIRKNLKPTKEWVLTREGVDALSGLSFLSPLLIPVKSVGRFLNPMNLIRKGPFPKSSPEKFDDLDLKKILLSETEARNRILTGIRGILETTRERLRHAAGKSDFARDYLPRKWQPAETEIDFEKLEKKLEHASRELIEKIKATVAKVMENRNSPGKPVGIAGGIGVAGAATLMLLDYLFLFGAGIGAIGLSSSIGLLAGGGGVAKLIDKHNRGAMEKIQNIFDSVFREELLSAVDKIINDMTVFTVPPEIAEGFCRIDSTKTGDWEYISSKRNT